MRQGTERGAVPFSMAFFSVFTDYGTEVRVLKEEFLSGRKKESGEENAPGGEGGLRRESICDPLFYRPDSDKI